MGNISHYLKANSNCEMLVIHYPVNPEAPFDFKLNSSGKFEVYTIDRAPSIEQKIADFKPQVILCSGWGNKNYLAWVKKYGKNAKNVICFDNQWLGTFKQRFLSLISSFTFLRRFKYAWVPGDPQKEYALKLGFKSENVFTGLYPADTELFRHIGVNKLDKRGPYPKIFLSVARYIKQKDLTTLWQAFIEANAKCGNHWKLDCIGYGDLFESRIQNEHIRHNGFKQPNEMESFLMQSGVYVLPSTYEPWGVAVHEMAICALPLVLSNKVGSATMFLKPDNGFSFEAGNTVELSNILMKIMNMDDQQLWNMAERSYIYSQNLSSKDWSDTLSYIASAEKKS